jgi:anaerobic selenocysteine-containing dehydrogenase
MKSLDRRNFMKLSAASGAVLAAGAVDSQPALAGTVTFAQGGRDFSPVTGKERKAIPTACWQCVTRDSMIGFVEDGRLVKLEGHPDSIRTRGVICAKGQAGINQVYFPDRILYPLRRVGARGEHKWKRITWDEALDEIAGRLQPLLDAGTPEKLMYQYGRNKASQAKVTYDFLHAFGTNTIGNHTSICEGGKWTSQELVWGGHYDNWDFDKTDFVLIFGSNMTNTHTNHIPTSQRLIEAHVERGVPVYVFDVRLTNTGAFADEWIPIKVGKDGLVALAMCNVIMEEGLYKTDLFKFMKVSADRKASVDDKIAAVKEQVASFTPEFAEQESMVSADKIRDLARQFAKAKSAALVSYRGTIAHQHGSDQERAMLLLSAITGNINSPGGRCQGVGAGWSAPSSPAGQKTGGKLSALDVNHGFPGQVAYPTHKVSNQVLKMIKDGSHGRPDVYIWSCYNPVYVNGEMAENREIMKDESIMPFLVSVNIVYDESSSLADIILPDVTYLERWDWEDMVSPTQVAEFYFRQPLVKPLGETRDIGDMWVGLAERLGLELTWTSKEDFVRQSCEMTPGIKEAGGFEYMKQKGVWHDVNAEPDYYGFQTEIPGEAVTADGVIFDEATGVYWNWQKSKAKSEAEAKEVGYQNTPKSYKGYVGQEMDGAVYRGFKPDAVNKSGFLEFYSELMKAKDMPVFPTYTPVPEHVAMAPDELNLTTYKVGVHTHSRTSHCKWLSEIYHDNPGWMNPTTAAERGLQDGDKIRVYNQLGEITTHVHVTEGIIPGVIAISYHVGREHSGRYGSGNPSPIPGVADDDPDFKNKWWDKHGVHPNSIIVSTPDQISGQQRWMDTVVRVEKA